MGWKRDANGVLHWSDDPVVTMSASGHSTDDRWEDPSEGESGGNDNGDNGDDGGDNGDNGDNGGGDNGDNGDNGGDNGGGDNGGGDNGGDNGSGGNDNNGGSDQGGFDSQGNDNNFGVEQSQQSRDDWFSQQNQNYEANQQQFNQGWQNDFSGRVASDRQSDNSDMATANPNNFGSDPNDEVHQAFQWYQDHGISLLGNDPSAQPSAPPTSPVPAVNPYQYSGQTPTTSNGSVFSTMPAEQQANYAPAPQGDYQPLDLGAAQRAVTAPPPEPEHRPQDISGIDMTPPLPAAAVTGGSAQQAATAAATATATAGGTPQEIAQAAVIATKMLALDNQTLDQQSAWTRQIFKSTYGPNADQEWVRQHNAELQRNKALYGSEEPTAGTAPQAGAPAGTGPAPDRRIGVVPAPGPNETARYGSTPVSVPQPSPSRPTSDAAPVAPPPGAPGPTVGPNPATYPAHNASTDTRLAPTSLPGPEMGGPIYATPPAAPSGNTSPQYPSNAETDTRLQPRLPDINPQTGEPTGLNTPAPNAAVAGGSINETQDTADSIPGAHSVSGAMIDPSEPNIEFYPDGTARDAKSGQIIGTYDASNPPKGLVPAGLEGGPRSALLPGERTSAIIPNQSGSSSLPGEAVPGAQSGGALPGDVVPNPDRVQTALNSARPIDTLAELSAKPGEDSRQEAINITNGIGAMLRGDPAGAWAEPYLNDVARLSWAREERQNGRVADPRDTPDDYIEHWKDAFFGSDQRVPMVKELNQQMIDYAVDRTPPGKPFDWKQAYGSTGENGLISRQIYGNDCGPNAFSTILRSRGYNTDEAQTYQFAVKNGYHNGDEFLGPGNMERMLRNAGLDAKASPIEWGTVDSELDAGRPVVLSSDGHYWVVSARRDGPNGTQYYAGATAGIVSNPQWATAGQIRYGRVNGGAPTVMVTAKGDVDPGSQAVKALNLQPPGLTQGGRREDLSPSNLMNNQMRMMTNRSQDIRQDDGVATDSARPQTLGAGAVNSEPSERANLNPRFSEQDTINMRDRILHEAPQIQLTPDMSVEDRMRAIAPTMDWIQKEYNVPADVLAGMMYNESHVGAIDSPASKANNLLSIQYLPTDSQATGLAPGQSRWAAYPSVNSNLARFLGMYAHPENGHQKFWANRGTPDSFIQGLKDDHYVVDEPGAGNSIREWEAGVRTGMKMYHQAVGR